MRAFSSLFLAVFVSFSAFAEDIIAVFPPHSVNTDQSFSDAFGMLLASKYRKQSEQDVLAPNRTSHAIGEDGDLIAAARQLGASEYLETEAVGLYLSRKEKAQVELGGTEGASKTIIVKIDNAKDHDDDDQKLLDNHKTVVTVTRRDANGIRIHMVEMTLVTYGDIEESTDRIAEALYKKVSVDEILGLYNVTRREGMGHNKMFVDKLKGVKVGYIHPLASNANIVPIVSIGYNQRFDSEKFFLEFGGGGRLPTKSDRENDRYYGGAYMHMGTGYYFIRRIFGLHAAIGVSPLMSVGSSNGLEIGLLPFIQTGVSFPRNSKVQGFFNIKIGQNVLEVTTGREADDDYSYSYSDPKTYPPPIKSYPTEITLEFGIGF